MCTIGERRLTFVGNGVALRREDHVLQAEQRQHSREAAEAALAGEDLDDHRDMLARATVADAPVGGQRFDVHVSERLASHVERVPSRGDLRRLRNLAVREGGFPPRSLREPSGEPSSDL